MGNLRTTCYAASAVFEESRLRDTMSGLPYSAAPLLGESNEEIYCERLGYKKEELEMLKTKGVI